MKIALITLDYPSEHGGVARYLGNLVRVSDGMIDVFVNETHATDGPGHVESVRLVHTGLIPWWPMIGQILGMKKRGYDRVLVSHALPVGTAAWITSFFGGLPYIVLMHGLDLRLAQAHPRKRWLLRHILRRASLVLTNSDFTANEIRSMAPTVRPRVLTPGVEPIDFPSRPTARQTLGIPSDQIVLLSVTRLVPRKGIDRLLEALPHLPPYIRLVIVGDGEDRGRLERLVGTLTDRVTCVTHATDEERNQWYAAADIFALPVRDDGRDVEGFGIVYLEAALAGLPVIAGKSGGAGEAVVDGETGILVDPTDTSAIAAAVRQLANDPTLRQKFGEAGRERARRDFRWEERVEILTGLLFELTLPSLTAREGSDPTRPTPDAPKTNKPPLV